MANDKKKKDLQFLESLVINRDLDWIQTSNLLSRNQDFFRMNTSFLKLKHLLILRL